MRRLLAILTVLAPLGAAADEGMWTFDAFPSEKVQRAYGFSPTPAWLENVRLSSVRLARGCSGSFVSEQGLVLTNHHCAHSCIEQLSRAGKDFVKDGFYAKAAGDEPRCPDVEVNQLVGIADVTARIRAATKGLERDAYEKALRGEMAKVEKECQTSDALRCDVVSLYQGGLYHLYTYRRFQDVRLVFAPELAIAFFGGDPDNFNFPRYDLDVAFLRVYEGGKPARMKNWFRWSAHGAAPGEVTFVTGHPGGTSRTLTVAQLEYQRDVALPSRLLQLAELRGLVTGFQMLGAEQKRISTARLFYVENSYKALRGRLEALQDPEFFRSKVTAETALRAEVAKDPEKARTVLPAYEAIEKAQRRLRELRKELNALENGFDGDLFRIARTLVRGAEERPRPNPERLREFRESNLPVITQQLFSEAPIYPEFERLLLGHALTKIREQLGADHPAVKKLLGKESPQEVADRVVNGTKLADVATRRKLWDGGAQALGGIQDPLVALAKLVDPDARAVRKTWEEEVDAVVKKSHEAIAEARFAVQGRTAYPDATFTLRLSYGQVKGWKEGTLEVQPYTTVGGAFERATGRDPFALPESWLSARPRLELGTRFNFATTNDIIGGNSGSPVVNRNAEIVGLIFDGNIHSLGGDYGFDESVNRAVAVHSDAILEALAKIYGAQRIADELRPAAKGAAGGGKKKR
ncbi:MAG TPA: S46 family peptidase [Anaeromyxobacter sp.]|nr:S46 family peptidase [Anaeromyxobacter sp.]